MPGCPDGPWRCVVEHDGVRDVDVAVGALHVWTQDLALDLFPGHEVILISVCNDLVFLHVILQ